MPAAERTCAGCGAAFVPLGTEDSEQIDWQVTITRIVHRRLRYRRFTMDPTRSAAVLYRHVGIERTATVRHCTGSYPGSQTRGHYRKPRP